MADDSYHGACHCQAVRFRVRLLDGFRTMRRCTCSMCRMRGAVVVSAAIEDFELISGDDALGTYQFGTMTAKHHFCRRCGIYTHHKRRSNPHLYGINVACLEGVSPFDFAEVPVTDGQNHPRDAAQPSGVPTQIGWLRFDPEPS